MLKIVANLLSHKMAAKADIIENDIRQSVNTLWKYAHGGNRVNLLEQCAFANVSKPEGPEDNKAIYGKKFCENVVKTIDEIHSNINKISPSELKSSLINLAKLIDDNKFIKFSENGRPAPKSGDVAEKMDGSQLQFEHVAILGAMLISGSTKPRLIFKQKAGAQIRTELSRILSLSISLVEKLNELSVMAPEKFDDMTNTVNVDDELPERFTPDRGQLTRKEIEWFLDRHGRDYGIYNKDDWSKLTQLKPEMLPRLTTMINALRRGKVPAESGSLRLEIRNALDDYSSEPV